MGPYNYENRNERRWRLLRFSIQNELKIVNTIFKKRTRRQWTWIAPNQESKSQTDYIITTEKERKIRDFKI